MKARPGRVSVRPARIVVIADTHVRTAPGPGRKTRPIPPAVWQAARGAAAILHAGDVLDAGVLQQLAQHAPVHAVLGNNDLSLVGSLPPFSLVDVAGVRIGLVHDAGPATGRPGRLHRRFPDADVVVFGHSHAPVDEVGQAGQLLFNPGSPTQRRAQPRCTFGELLLARGSVVDHRIIPVDGDRPACR
jgi:putative phosphoesterase